MRIEDLRLGFDTHRARMAAADSKRYRACRRPISEPKNRKSEAGWLAGWEAKSLRPEASEALRLAEARVLLRVLEALGGLLEAPGGRTSKSCSVFNGFLEAPGHPRG